MKRQINYPSSLHRYRMHYADGGSRTVTACGATNAYHIANNLDPNREVINYEVLDDSWKIND